MLFLKERPNIDCLVVGLGNYGKKYEATRHNAGFMAIDYMVSELNLGKGKQKFQGLIYEKNIDGKKFLFVQPYTYMNRSGECVAKVAKYYNIPSENMIMIYDDMDLDTGKLRIRYKGTDGGHNGMKSIIRALATYNIPRIRIGIDRSPKAEHDPDYDIAEWVLSNFKKSEKQIIDSAMPNVMDAVMLIANGKIDEAMNKYN